MLAVERSPALSEFGTLTGDQPSVLATSRHQPRADAGVRRVGAVQPGAAEQPAVVRAVLVAARRGSAAWRQGGPPSARLPAPRVPQATVRSVATRASSQRRLGVSCGRVGCSVSGDRPPLHSSADVSRRFAAAAAANDRLRRLRGVSRSVTASLAAPRVARGGRGCRVHGARGAVGGDPADGSQL